MEEQTKTIDDVLADAQRGDVVIKNVKVSPGYSPVKGYKAVTIEFADDTFLYFEWVNHKKIMMFDRLL
jgi:hypothetical protein